MTEVGLIHVTSRPRVWTALALAVCVSLLPACDRPFVDPVPAAVEVISPNPGVVQEVSDIELVVRVAAFRQVDRVTLFGEPMDFTPTGTWTAAVTLHPGHNRLIVEAFDAEGTAGTDTLHYLHLTPEMSEIQGWQGARGAHSATLLSTGDVLFAGGAPTLTGSAGTDLYLLPVGSEEIRPLDSALAIGRAGHTASLLPNGQVLFVGGSRVPILEDVASLVEAPEIYDPATGVSRTLPVDGPPIRRAFHTATIRLVTGRTVLDLLGGTGDVLYSPEPELGVRQDLRSFLVTTDSLVALSPAVGPFIQPLTGHTQTALVSQPVGIPTRQLVAGAFFDEFGGEAHHFILNPAAPSGIEFKQLPAPTVLRNQGAAARIGGGQVIRVGGVPGGDLSPVGSVDLFDDSVGRFLDFSDSGAIQLVDRHLLRATFLLDGRILISGGFDADGTSRTTTEIITF